MIKVAIIGYGVVGSGVAEVIHKNAPLIKKRCSEEVSLKKILDLREFPNDPYQHLVVHDMEEVLGDEEIEVVVETVGGATFAYELTKQALSRGKHVVTSNKELVAKHGPELIKLAAENQVKYFFEAAVGGGIPIINALYGSLAANRIDAICGIVNGTTNYILGCMDEAGISFAEALKQAQNKGYAEQNPASDIDGIDSVRKLAILTSIVTGIYIDSADIYTEGISKIQEVDLLYAKQLKRKIKLLATMEQLENGELSLMVAPMLIQREHPVCSASGVFNAIMVQGDALGETMFYGKGAGKLATASAVVADVMDCINPTMHASMKARQWDIISDQIVEAHGDKKVKVLLRVDKSLSKEDLEKIFSGIDVNEVKAVTPTEQAFILGQAGDLTEAIYATGFEKIKSSVFGFLRLL